MGKSEGIPLTFHSPVVAKAMVEKIGTILKFDEKSQVLGFKKWMRALGWVRVSKPLVLGCFFEY